MGVSDRTDGVAGILGMALQGAWGRLQFVPAPAVILTKLSGMALSDITAVLALVLLAVQIAAVITDKWPRWAPLPARVFRAAWALLGRLAAAITRNRAGGDQCGLPLGAKGKPTLAAPLAVLSAIVMALGVSEGDPRVPYRDAAGVWTVCKGITGPAVVPGRKYTDAECAHMTNQAVRSGTDAIARCIARPMYWHEWVAWGHFVHNVGASAFCGSTAAKLLRAGAREQACAEIPRWRFVTIAGLKRDCSERRWDCYGVVNRRAWEEDMCRGRIPSSAYPDIEAWLKESAA